MLHIFALTALSTSACVAGTLDHVEPSGLQYTITKRGHGPKPEDGDIIVFKSTGSIVGGKGFEDRVRAIPFGKRTIPVAGLQEGVQLLREGDEAHFRVPPELGYGASGRPQLGIPPNSTLEYRVAISKIYHKTISKTIKDLLDGGNYSRVNQVISGIRDGSVTDVFSSESMMTYLGDLYLSRQNRNYDAIWIFTWETELYPNSSNAWDSLADAYLLDGQLALARRSYARALALSPNDRHSSLWKSRVEMLGEPMPAIPSVDLIRLRLRYAGTLFADDIPHDNLPLDTQRLEKEVWLFLSDSKELPDIELSKIVAQFFDVVERESREEVKEILDRFALSPNVAIRNLATTRLYKIREVPDGK